MWSAVFISLDLTVLSTKLLTTDLQRPFLKSEMASGPMSTKKCTIGNDLPFKAGPLRCIGNLKLAPENVINTHALPGYELV
jgi:hypothetical protein